MRQLVGVGLVLLLPTVAWADVGPLVPGYRTVWVDYTFVIEQNEPDFAFFFVPGNDQPAERVLVTPSSPVRVSGPGEHHEHVRGTLYAVRTTLLGQFPDARPPRDWFWKNTGNGVVRLEVDTNPSHFNLEFRRSLPFTDTRSRVEITYRIELSPSGGKLVQVAENAGNPWVKWGWGISCILISVGLAGLGLWLMRRYIRRRAGSQ